MGNNLSGGFYFTPRGVRPFLFIGNKKEGGMERVAMIEGLDFTDVEHMLYAPYMLADVLKDMDSKSETVQLYTLLSERGEGMLYLGRNGTIPRVDIEAGSDLAYYRNTFMVLLNPVNVDAMQEMVPDEDMRETLRGYYQTLYDMVSEGDMSRLNNTIKKIVTQMEEDVYLPLGLVATDAE